MLPLDDPPNAIRENGRGLLFLSFKQYANPFCAKLVLPIPGNPSKPKQ